MQNIVVKIALQRLSNRKINLKWSDISAVLSLSFDQNHCCRCYGVKNSLHSWTQFRKHQKPEARSPFSYVLAECPTAKYRTASRFCGELMGPGQWQWSTTAKRKHARRCMLWANRVARWRINSPGNAIAYPSAIPIPVRVNQHHCHARLHVP